MEDTTLGFDFQGWPIRKMSLGEIIKDSQIFEHDDEKGIFYIKDDNPLLKLYPRTLEDDGMGYGVNEKYITEVSVFPSGNLTSTIPSDEYKINVFIHPQENKSITCQLPTTKVGGLVDNA